MASASPYSGLKSPIPNEYNIGQVLISTIESSFEAKEALFHLFNDEEFWCVLDGDENLVEKGVLEG